MNKLPNRKYVHLKHFDYASSGAYFVTICTHERRHYLSSVVGSNSISPYNELLSSVENSIQVELTELGIIAEQVLFDLEERFSNLIIDSYVIMPDHIHILFVLKKPAQSTTVETQLKNRSIMDIVCTYKSLTTRYCKQKKSIQKLFQASFYEHIIRNREDYERTRKYIYENPIRWFYDGIYDDK